MVSENGGVMEVVADMELRFKSGNSVPVDRAYITAEQWQVIRAALVHGIVNDRPTKGCGATLSAESWWKFCGETDMGQSSPALCTECGGPFSRAE